MIYPAFTSDLICLGALQGGQVKTVTVTVTAAPPAQTSSKGNQAATNGGE